MLVFTFIARKMSAESEPACRQTGASEVRSATPMCIYVYYVTYVVNNPFTFYILHFKFYIFSQNFLNLTINVANPPSSRCSTRK